jgi:hypothetical protein
VTPQQFHNAWHTNGFDVTSVYECGQEICRAMCVVELPYAVLVTSGDIDENRYLTDPVFHAIVDLCGVAFKLKHKDMDES